MRQERLARAEQARECELLSVALHELREEMVRSPWQNMQHVRTCAHGSVH